MATVNDILQAKGQRAVLSVERTESVLNATRRMNEYTIGSLIVTDGGRLCGIFTERDVLRRIVVDQRDPATTTVGEVMTTEVACCTLETNVDDARTIMKTHRVRHVPVVTKDGELCGLISIGDLNAHMANDREVTIHFLNEYLHGRT